LKPMPTHSQWLSCWHGLGVCEAQIPAGLYEIICARYTEAHRHYHTLQHLDECLEHFAVLRELTEHPAEIELALWFHDAVYEPTRPDNEQISADWAAESVKSAGLDDNIADRIRKLIMATRHDGQPESIDAEIMLDCDLAVLGTTPERFAEYGRQIRAEYDFVPVLLYESKRAEILQQFLDRPAIFNTEIFRKRYGKQARTNLNNAIGLLK
jgi:predicted metal-dependent HD superfamily phosphohydrolase